MRIDFNNLAPVAPATSIASRALANAESELLKAVSDLPIAPEQQQTTTTLSQDNLRAALLDLGVAADAESLQLAEAFARLGLPLTDANIVEGRAIMARYPKMPAAAYAMAKMLDAPLTAGVLRALTRVIEGAMTKSPLPESVLSELSLALDGGADPRALAKDLYSIISRLGRSTEQRITDASGDPAAMRALLRSDPRAQLLSVASESMDKEVRMAADAHAAHIEGQQLFNQIALRRFDPPVPLYFAFPFKIGAETVVPAEVQVWTRDEEEKGSRDDEFGKPGLALQTIIRINPPRLGCVEIRLSGRQDASLTCQVLVEKTASYRLLRRHASDLAGGLSNAGWNVSDVAVGMAQSFTPLWYGGAALDRPRGRVDRKA